MTTHRTAIAGACVTLAMLTAGACGQVNELVTGRDVVCESTPDDICMRVADQVASAVPREDPASGPVAKVTVTEQECGNEVPPVVRCWHVEAETRPDARGMFNRLGGQWRLRADGMLTGSLRAGVSCPCPE
jgi:hypothetical protein